VKAPKRKPKAKPPKRVGPEIVTAQRKWMVDFDYVKTLPEYAKTYLAQFADEYYRADFRYEGPMHDTVELQRERYNSGNAAGRDAYTMSAVWGNFGDAPVDNRVANVVSLYPIPKYQSHEEYKTALGEYRKLVDVKERSQKQQDRLELLQAYLLSQHESDTRGNNE
jgi:hypothetical protein